MEIELNHTLFQLNAQYGYGDGLLSPKKWIFLAVLFTGTNNGLAKRTRARKVYVKAIDFTKQMFFVGKIGCNL